MTPTQQTALDRAIVLLGAAGVQFAILTPEGTKFGTLDIVEKKGGKITRKRTGINYRPIYQDILNKMEVGSCEKVQCPEGVGLENLRSTITAYCTQKWGKESYISSINKEVRYIEILRLT